MSERKWQHGEIGSLPIVMTDAEIRAASAWIGRGVRPQEAMELVTADCRCMEFFADHLCGKQGPQEDS